MKININDQFAVRLTDNGYARLVRETDMRFIKGRVWTENECAETLYPERSDGTRVFQLHELMRYFGADMSMASTAEELPFATDIEWLGPS